MKRILFFVTVVFCILAFSQVRGQKLNGQTFTFPNGKTEWSDTIYKKLLTKEMAKEGTKAVLIGIRYKYIKPVEEGYWYEIEITNKSPDTKIKFKVSSGKSQEIYTVRLNPNQTKTIQRLRWLTRPQGSPDTEDDYFTSPFDEILQNRE